MASIKEIAELAGVSRGTVDRVLNHRGSVSPEKEKKVLEIADEDERTYYEAICGRKDPDHGANALNFLSGVLYRYYNKKVIILLDEYDTPLIEAFSEGCWNEMFKYIKFLFSNSFKNNE